MTLSKIDTFFLVSVFILGLLQVVGFAVGSQSIRGLGIISTASPLPFVFSAHDGLETFAQRYAVEFMEEQSGEGVSRIEVDAALYSQLRGVYNYRNTYGALFSHGPVLAKNNTPLIDSVARFALCTGGPLLEAFAPAKKPMKVILESTPNAAHQMTWRHEVVCP